MIAGDDGEWWVPTPAELATIEQWHRRLQEGAFLPAGSGWEADGRPQLKIRKRKGGTKSASVRYEILDAATPTPRKWRLIKSMVIEAAPPAELE